jgi:hypothetical protein
MSLTRLEVSLEQFEVGISGAVPERKLWSELAMDRAILEFVSLFCGLVFKYGGRIVHGSQPSFTPVILRQARLHAAGRKRPPVTLVVSDLWAQDWNDDDRGSLTDIAEVVITKSEGFKGAADAETRNASLSKMRNVLARLQNTMVAVGGKRHGGDGLIAGVAEEVQLARERGIPRFLIGGLGGNTRDVARRATPASLDNFLTRDANSTLLRTTDVSASVNVLFEHFIKSSELSKSLRRPYYWDFESRAMVDPRGDKVPMDMSSSVLRVLPERTFEQDGY